MSNSLLQQQADTALPNTVLRAVLDFGRHAPYCHMRVLFAISHVPVH
jgi:hypothetical protein